MKHKRENYSRTELRAALGGLSRVFRETTTVGSKRRRTAFAERPRTDVGKCHPDEARTKDLAQLLRLTVVGFEELDRDVRALGAKDFGIAELARDLLRTDDAWRLQLEKSSPLDVEGFVSFFEQVQRQEYALAGVASEIVPLFGSLASSLTAPRFFDVREHRGPETGGTWISRVPDPAQVPDIWQVLEYQFNPFTLVRVRLTWVGKEVMIVQSGGVDWSPRPYRHGEDVGTEYLSPLLVPTDGRAQVTMMVAEPGTASDRIVASYEIWIDLTFQRGDGPRPVIRPTPIPTPVPNPSPPSFPRDLTTFDPAQLNGIRNRASLFLRETLGNVTILAGTIGWSALLDEALVAAALEAARLER